MSQKQIDSINDLFYSAIDHSTDELNKEFAMYDLAWNTAFLNLMEGAQSWDM